MKNALYVILRVVLKLISRLPFWVLYLLSDLVYYLLFYVFKYRQKVVEENLLNAFPNKTLAERNSIRKAFTKYLADLLVETIKSFTISKRQLESRVTVNNGAYIDACFKNGQSVIAILGHYANWEMTGQRISKSFSGRTVFVYKPLSDKFFDDLMLGMRSRFGATLVSMKNIMRKLVQYKNERTITFLVGDQTPPKSEIKYFTDFLNQPTPVFLGVERLAKMTNSVVVYCDIRRVGKGHYACNFVPLCEQPIATAEYEITEQHVKYLEGMIEREPQYWLWSHRRWKYKPADLTGHDY